MTATASPVTTIPANFNPYSTTNATEALLTSYTYLDGTTLPTTVIRDGEKTVYTYDYRQRLTQATTYPRNGQTLVASKTYLDNLLFSTQDPYGRKTYFGVPSFAGENGWSS